MIKILFLIHDLGQGGAEKVLVNLVNNMNPSLFEIHVTSLFAGGINEQFIAPHIFYRTIWNKTVPGNSKLMKLLSPKQLHKICVKEHYDIEVSYLEGPSARIISGCEDKNTKLYCWIHQNHFSMRHVAASFRSIRETHLCYEKFNQIICVSKNMQENFCNWIPVRDKCRVLYNTVESDKILAQSLEETIELIEDETFKLIAVGSLKKIKGFDRLLRVVKRLNKQHDRVHLYLLGDGPMKEEMEDFICVNKLDKTVSLLGYQINPYKYVAKCDLFVCSSFSEGFSTAVTEALIVGVPVCTVDVSGMRELLGDNNEYGLITENSEEALFAGIEKLLDDSDLLEYYRHQANIRGKFFQTAETVGAVERMFLGIEGTE